MQFIADIGAGAVTDSVTQTVLVENRSNSEFGPGWTLEGLEILTIDTDGAVYTNGFGLAAWYALDSDGTYTFDHKNGGSSDFTSTGQLISQTDVFGNSVITETHLAC